MKICRCFALIISLPFIVLNTLYCDTVPSSPVSTQIPFSLDSPWITGPLLVPSGVVVPKGQYEFEPYLYFMMVEGIYNKNWDSISLPTFYNFNTQLYTVVGLTTWMDFQITPQIFYNFHQGQSTPGFGDLPIGFDFQLCQAGSSNLSFAVKASLRETFPTGNYQKLDPNKKGTDLTGLGSYATYFNLVFYKVYHLYALHYLSSTLSFSYTLFSPAHVRGFNAYGGGYGTHGTVNPGNSFSVIWSFEYTLTKNWVLALDNVYIHNNQTHFSGKKGNYLDGSPALMGLPSSEQISFAPAIEYNFSSTFGIISGVWFSACGRNSAKFISPIFAAEWTF